MKRLQRSDGHTGKRDGEAGGIVLEASLIMPIVLMVIVFFICLIRLSAVQMALHGAASQVTRQAAAHMYPVALAAEQFAKSAPSQTNAAQPLPGVETVAGALEAWLPQPAGPLLAAAVKGDWQGVGNAVAAEAGRAALEPLLRQAAEGGLLSPERLRLQHLSLPDLPSGSSAYIRVQVEYSFPLGLPFMRKTLLLREQAEERVWVADHAAAPRNGTDGEQEQVMLQIVAIEPDPLHPGRTARLIARTDPGRQVSLSIEYKSGTSKAKHLGEATADENGYAEWTWLVSGNTTPGVWEAIVRGEGGARAARHFDVKKRNAASENDDDG
ncbi:TadE/TadG family type IV pilus assembly protein [Paenibacillus mendelii]|uniref:TadE/TadG family type IV pilus assembly protein n=1 Tax=Paenibacillus mendelii TaxID=206163 RepID=A0ABV6JMY9_9BACL|nr:hypothetical protein [Paenibacillus mendelii]MCQ6559122.1 hypothetical protein [Paenibacillus mendelii]